MDSAQRLILKELKAGVFSYTLGSGDSEGVRQASEPRNATLEGGATGDAVRSQQGVVARVRLVSHLKLSPPSCPPIPKDKAGQSQ